MDKNFLWDRDRSYYSMVHIFLIFWRISFFRNQASCTLLIDKMKPLIKMLMIATAIFALATLYLFEDVESSTIFPRCIFYSLTGLYCPGCGSQRAFSALIHGNFLQAVNFNLLFILMVPLLVYSSLVAVINLFKKEKLVQQIFYSTYFVRILFVAVLIFWAARNLNFYPFALLAPHTIH